MAKKVILFTLQTFSTTGGIQKMTRTLAHALNVLAHRNNWDFTLWSAYDTEQDLMPQYLPKDKFKAFGINRINFVLKTITAAKKPDVIIISHINLAIIGLLIKTIHPKCKVLLISHGIEVWRPLTLFKKIFLKKCDGIICVSNFTKHQMISRHHTDPALCTVLNNAVDPFMRKPESFLKPAHLQKKYRITADDQVIFTLTRLSSSEQYKGHDQVIKAVSLLKLKFPQIKYVLSGQYDHAEEMRLNKLITQYQVGEQVILTGFIQEEELVDHFLLADIFVLPSKKEGFGIVFIEALSCGLPVICGNADGSIDAIANGELGTAIDADNISELETALDYYLQNPINKTERQALQHKCLSLFNEANYIDKLKMIIT
jgi:phosphatidylinositol alpha-1,6-mannosyltransferase